MNQGFKLTIQLRTPALLNPHMTLDSLLAAALFRQTHSVDRALAEIPLQQRDGIWCGSALQLERGHYTDQAFTQALRTNDFDPGNYSDQRRRGGGITVLIGGGTYKPALDHVRPWIGKLSFLGCGDAEACRSLVESLPGIGAKANAQGLGRIESVEVEEAQTDGLCEADRPLRAIPVETWKGWGFGIDESIAVDLLRYKPPYWGGDSVPCVFRAPVPGAPRAAS